MAWLITLALFLWIGGGIAKSIDHGRDKRFVAGHANLQKYEMFWHNLYTASWYYYQEIEPQVISEWENQGHSGDPYGVDSRFLQFQTEVFGEPAEQHAIHLALKDFMQHDIPIYQPNPDQQMGKQYGMAYILLHNKDSVNLKNLAREIWLDTFLNFPKLYYFYDFHYACQSNAPYVYTLMPEIDDPRVYSYRCNGNDYRRSGRPSYYSGMLEQARCPIRHAKYKM